MSRILITGASAGIGKALALELAREGHQLILTARRRSELDKAAKACLLAGAGDVHVITADISKNETIAPLIAEATAAFGGLDTVVANAGVAKHVPVDKLTWADCDWIFRTNIDGAIAVIIAALPAMLKRGSGHIVGVSSLAAFRGMPPSGPYCASKAAFTAYLEALRIELSGRGVAVSVVSPGFVSTDLTAKNKFPMPFIMDATKAARIIARGMARRKRHIAFPLPVHFFMRVMQILPAGIYDRMVALTLPRGNII